MPPRTTRQAGSLGRTLHRRASHVLAYFDWPGISDGSVRGDQRPPGTSTWRRRRLPQPNELHRPLSLLETGGFRPTTTLTIRLSRLTTVDRFARARSCAPCGVLSFHAATWRTRAPRGRRASSSPTLFDWARNSTRSPPAARRQCTEGNDRPTRPVSRYSEEVALDV